MATIRWHVRMYVDAFNKGDATQMAEAFAVPGVDPGRDGPARLAGADRDRAIGTEMC